MNAFCLLLCFVSAAALEARWTPAADGGPARFSKRYRDAAGIDDSRWTEPDAEEGVSTSTLLLAGAAAAEAGWQPCRRRRGCACGREAGTHSGRRSRAESLSGQVPGAGLSRGARVVECAAMTAPPHRLVGGALCDGSQRLLRLVVCRWRCPGAWRLELRAAQLEESESSASGDGGRVRVWRTS